MALTKISTGGVKDDTADEAKLKVSNAGTNGQFLQKQSGNTGGLTWATVTVPDADKVIEGDTSVETVDTGSDGHVKITTEGTERLRVLADGKVGVGLNNPGLKFHVQDGALSSAPTPNGNCDVVIEGTSSTGIQFLSGSQTQLRFGDANSTAAGAIIYSHSDDNFKLNYANSGYLSLNDGGGETFRFTPNNEIGIAGANYGTSGQVLTSGGSGSAVSWADAGGFWTNLHQGSYTFDSTSDSESITGLGGYDMLRIYMMVSATGNSLTNPFPRITIGTSSGMKDDNYQSETTSSQQSSAGGQAGYWPHTQPSNFGNPGGDYGAGILTGEIFIANWQGTSYHTIGHFSGGYTSGTNQRLADYSGSIAHRDVANYDRIGLKFASAGAQNTALLKITIQGSTYS